MTKVKVVNRQKIDGTEYKRGQVVEFDDGRARDLIARGKAVQATEEDEAKFAARERAEVEAIEAAQREAEEDASVDKAAPVSAEPEAPIATPDDTPKKAGTPRAAKKPTTGEKETADV